jgi:transposase
MQSITKHVGLDVHKESIAIAEAEEGREPAVSRGQIPNNLPRLLKALDRIGPRASLRVCYEAGPTGYGLQRELAKAGIDCIVVAPSMVPSKAGDRVKTDKRDAKKLAHYLRSGDLTAVHVPDSTTESLRDLFRARDDAKVNERAARHRLSKFLLRHDRRYPGKTAWTGMHLDWIRTLKFDHDALNRVLREYLRSVEDATEQVARLTSDIEELAQQSEVQPLTHSHVSPRVLPL